MTTLQKILRRRVPAERRDLVVTLKPNPRGALIEVREAKRRKGFEISIATLYLLCAQREADRIVAEKREEKKRKARERREARRGR